MLFRSIIKNSSFLDMFHNASDEAVKIINCCEKYFAGEAEMPELLATAKNLSFASGLPYTEDVEFKFSDIVYLKAQ